MNEKRFNPLGIGMGSRIADRYEIAKMVGAGAMSAVYKAYDKELNNQPCALKILSSALTNEQIDLERFRSEVMITRTLTHEGIIRTFEFGQAGNGLHYIAMEYLDGINLEQLIGRSAFEPLPLTDIIGILRSIAVPLAYAHARGVVHRDVKPANVLIGGNGEIKLADFGLAKTGDFQIKLTQAGEAVGSPAYMSPEQMRGQNVDSRTDIYSLGVIAFQMVARRLPFEAASPYELGAMVCREKFPHLKDVFSEAPLWLSDLVDKACAHMADDRFSTVEEFIEILDENATGSKGTMLSPNLEKPGAQAVFQSMFSGLDFSLIRVAPLMTFICLIAFVGLIVAGTSERPVKDVEATISRSSHIIKDLTHSVKELTEVAVEAHKRRDQIKTFIQEQSQDELDTAAEGADSEAANSEAANSEAVEAIESDVAKDPSLEAGSSFGLENSDATEEPLDEKEKDKDKDKDKDTADSQSLIEDLRKAPNSLLKQD